jgi:hypothetical protein
MNGGRKGENMRWGDDGLAGVGLAMDGYEGHGFHAMRWHIEMLSLCHSETPVSLPFLSINHFYLYNQPFCQASHSVRTDRQVDHTYHQSLFHSHIVPLAETVGVLVTDRHVQ